MIIRHKIWYVHINIYMKINMLHIEFIHFPFAHRVTEFPISQQREREREQVWDNMKNVALELQRWPVVMQL